MRAAHDSLFYRPAHGNREFLFNNVPCRENSDECHFYSFVFLVAVYLFIMTLITRTFNIISVTAISFPSDFA